MSGYDRIDPARLPFVTVGGLQIASADVTTLVEMACERLDAGATTQFVTVNPEIAQHCKHDERYGRLVRAAEIRTCDGIGVGLAAWAGTRRRLGRVTGVELTAELLATAAQRGLSLCVLGATEPSRTAFEDRARVQGVPVATGTSATFEETNISPFLDAARPARIVLVALGAPKQEQLIGMLRERLPSPRIMVGVGGAVDYCSGFAVRPPAIVRRLGLEWVFRLLTSRGARLRRQASTIPAFIWDEILLPGVRSLGRKGAA